MSVVGTLTSVLGVHLKPESLLKPTLDLSFTLRNKTEALSVLLSVKFSISDVGGGDLD